MGNIHVGLSEGYLVEKISVFARWGLFCMEQTRFCVMCSRENVFALGYEISLVIA